MALHACTNTSKLCLFSLILQWEKLGDGLALRSTRFFWDAAKTWEMSYKPLSVFSLFAYCFFQIELYQKKLSQFCQGWSVHTNWSLTRSRGWILFTYFLLFRWEPLCGFLSSEHQIPVTLLTLELSGLDSGSNGCGMDLVAAGHDDVSRCLPQKVPGTPPSLVSHLHLIFECPH